jgi:hypothetical protein
VPENQTFDDSFRISTTKKRCRVSSSFDDGLLMTVSTCSSAAVLMTVSTCSSAHDVLKRAHIPSAGIASIAS